MVCHIVIAGTQVWCATSQDITSKRVLFCSTCFQTSLL